MHHKMNCINSNNVHAVQTQIKEKVQYEQPYYASRIVSQAVITDYDHFPYRRFYRGDYRSSDPIIMEREAGWRPLHTSCYRDNTVPEVDPHRYCWQPACTTVGPCLKKTKHGFAITNNAKCTHPNYFAQP